MRAGQSPETAVINRCVFECKPQSRNIDWVGVDEGAVLMTRNFTADVGLFEDVHRLEQVTVFETDGGGELFYFLVAREAIENRIEIVQRVSDLVDRLFIFLL
jgi:hypothetical protein